MASPSRHPAVTRLLDDGEVRAAFDVLAAGLPGADLTSLLLAVFAERTTARTPIDLLRQYESDRFVGPGSVAPKTIAQVIVRAFEATDADFEPVMLAPLAPLGTHSVLGPVPQNNVVSTVRSTDVAADPTNSLALEAALRRRRLLDADPRSAESVLLSGQLRVVRAQPMPGPRSFAHFSLFGLVAAGRDRGDRSFEIDAGIDALQAIVAIASAISHHRVQVRLTAFAGGFGRAVEQITDALVASGVPCDIWPDREHGRSYYRSLAFKVYLEAEGETVEIADGGDVDWTQQLLGNRKERLVIAGVGLDRLATLASG